MEPLGALGALGAGVALLAHAVARLVALVPVAAVRVAKEGDGFQFLVSFSDRKTQNVRLSVDKKSSD